MSRNRTVVVCQGLKKKNKKKRIERIAEPQNHRIVVDERDLRVQPSSTHLLKQGHLQTVAQEIQGWTLQLPCVHCL